ncbi:hypothetical protein CSW08_08730 [Confluentibacter flavum]|uniref:DUF4129 domain-containing protein n=2 Tax=Confluentibacter flavum TaxID=1909700 RepID=A0A2N3HJY9_9FLAO|nr:hypothetical protein CSW08_08730 [Confluentibacter flavum]
MGNSSVMTFQEPNTSRTFDADFKDRYSGNKYNYEGKKIISKTPSGSGNYEDYKNKNPKVNVDDNDSFTINLGPLGWLFYSALFAAVGYLIYILLNEGGSGLFSSKRHKKIEDFEDITSENIENADINALINRAENNQDYRLAIRYYYLLVLKTLNLKNHIKFEDDKTNADYLNDIKSKPFSSAFEYISYLYNYIWYGEFPLDIDQYAKAKDKFVTLLNQVK